MSPQELLGTHGIKLPNYIPGRYYTTCPQCSRNRSRAHQNNNVLGVTIEADGSVRWDCNHCNWTGPQKGAGRNSGDRQELEAYIYRDAEGTVRFRKVRNLPGKTPRFWLERPDGNGRWLKGTKGVDTNILYRADEVAQVIATGRVVAVAEVRKTRTIFGGSTSRRLATRTARPSPTRDRNGQTNIPRSSPEPTLSSSTTTTRLAMHMPTRSANSRTASPSACADLI